MKKILTASLVAMMAVTAARAEIASTKYVDDADKVITDSIGTVPEGKTVVGMIGEAQTAATYDDTEVRGLISDNAEAIEADEKALADYKTEMVTTVSGLNTAISNEATARSDADTALDGRIDALEASNAEGGANAAAIAEAKKAGTDAQTYAEGVAADLAAYETANDAAVEAVKATADGAQVKSEADLAIGTATGGWTTLKALPEYCLTGSCALSSVDGAVQWVKIQ